MGSWLWFAVAIAVIYGSTNGVNFTDGLDGLAAGSAALVFAAFVIIAFWQFRHPAVYEIIPAASLDLAVIAGAMLGACAGFLWWNAAPARVFMGDVGALAIGGAMAGLALLTHTRAVAADTRWPLRRRVPERHRPGGVVPGASTGGCCAWRPFTTTSKSGGGPNSR